MSLPPADAALLAKRGIAHSVVMEGPMTCVIFTDWPVPPGYNRTRVDLLLRLPPGFPDVPPDMWWVDPSLQLASGGTVEATQVTEVHVGRTWQRWSRHFAPGQWQPGTDSLESFLARIRGEMIRSAWGGAAT